MEFCGRVFRYFMEFVNIDQSHVLPKRRECERRFQIENAHTLDVSSTCAFAGFRVDAFEQARSTVLRSIFALRST